MILLILGCSGREAPHTATRTLEGVNLRAKESPNNTKSVGLAPEGRKLVYTANVELVVPDPKRQLGFLSEALAELESLEGQYRGLVKQVEYSTVTLTFESEVPARLGEPSLGQSLKNLFASYSFVIKRLAVVLIGIFLYGIPLVVLSALLWLVFFGKIGLIRKLFFLVSAKEKGGKT